MAEGQPLEILGPSRNTGSLVGLQRIGLMVPEIGTTHGGELSHDRPRRANLGESFPRSL